ncbi:MAG: hypothetical protein OEQ39_09885 [Gammaproteobacteria bacterium]|nr:hypothetical protein [Gammaproteobacteria bacterium]MDH3377258.1 hypothetical protein [Gammaproteobacteria bacterium]
MKDTIIYMGLDVDDTQYHGSAFNKAAGEVIDFRCRLTLKGLVGQIKKVAKYFPGYAIRICYAPARICSSNERICANICNRYCDKTVYITKPRRKTKPTGPGFIMPGVIAPSSA